jgi:hypothetical protein
MDVLSMQIKKIDTHNLLQLFSRLNIRYHGFGTLKGNINGKSRALYDYYQCDSISDTQKTELKKELPSIEFFISQSQYAPEIKKGMIASPKAARLAQLNAA